MLRLKNRENKNRRFSTSKDSPKTIDRTKERKLIPRSITGSVDANNRIMESKQEQNSGNIDRRTNEKLSKARKWQAIDWKLAYQNVSELQNKIVINRLEGKATESLYKLQGELISTFDARAIAVRKVITNSGGKTPGMDGVILDSPEKYYQAIEDMREIVNKPKTYKAHPLRRVYIPKANGEQRPLGIPTVKDRIIQALYHLAIDPVVEEQSDPNSFGFRKERSTHDAIGYFRNYMDKAISPRWILEADITKCFDRIDHKFLLENTPMGDKHVLEQWLKAGIIYHGKKEDTVEGTPQGGIISPMLCNVALNGLEKFIKTNMTGKSLKIKIIRYADDLVVTGATKEILVQCQKLVEQFIAIRGLELNQLKTRITNIETGIDLLGFNIVRKSWKSGLNRKNNQKDVLIIKPSKKGIKSIISKIRDMVKKSKNLTELIINLNPVLRGWTEHKRISWHSNKIFQQLNLILWRRLKTKFVNRSMGRTSMRTNYRNIKRWGQTAFTDARGRELFDPAKVTTKKLRLKRLDLNPYLTINRAYFEKLKSIKILNRMKEKLFKKYKHLCPVCGQSLHGEEKIEIHHIKPRKEGGNNRINNLQPLHKICHIKITHETF